MNGGTRTALLTHDERVLHLLADGQPHTHHELYQLGVIAHSRAASLRKKGYTIAVWRDHDNYLYQLTGRPLSAPPYPHGLMALSGVESGGALSGPGSASTGGASTMDPPSVRVDEGARAAQLSLEVAA